MRLSSDILLLALFGIAAFLPSFILTGAFGEGQIFLHGASGILRKIDTAPDYEFVMIVLLVLGLLFHIFLLASEKPVQRFQAHLATLGTIGLVVGLAYMEAIFYGKAGRHHIGPGFYLIAVVAGIHAWGLLSSWRQKKKKKGRRSRRRSRSERSGSQVA